jgi:hypothetical protein
MLRTVARRTNAAAMCVCRHFWPQAGLLFHRGFQGELGGVKVAEGRVGSVPVSIGVEHWV